MVVTTYTSASGRKYVSGTVSGIDTGALIANDLSKKKKPTVRLNDQITLSKNKVSAFSNLQTETQNLLNAFSGLKSTKNSTGSASSASSTAKNVFDTKGTTVSSADSTITAKNVLTAEATGAAVAGNYTVVVKQLAQTQKVTSAEQVSKTAALGYAGNFSLNIDGKTPANISISADDTLEDLRAAINGLTATTGVIADIQSSSGGFKLILSGNTNNKPIQISGVTGDDVFTNLGLTDGSGNFSNITQAAQPAKIILDGSEVTSETNKFDGALSGLKLSISSAAPNSVITLNITNNVTGVKDAINSIITAFNKLNATVLGNQKVNEDGSVNSNQSLFGENILKSLGKDFTRIISGTGNNSSNTFNSLGALGIRINSKNELEIRSQSTLDRALEDNFAEVQSLFQSSLSSDNAALSVTKNNTKLNQSFNLDVTVDSSGNITGTSVDGSSDNFTISGNQLVGKTGTKYDGLTLNYTGGSATIAVKIQQGLADNLINILDGYSNASTGLISKQKKTLQDTEAALQRRVDKINNDAIAYEDKLIDKYAAMEANIKRSLDTQNRIKAFIDAANSR
jgi:flagellar hook-associated protein 2